MANFGQEEEPDIDAADVEKFQPAFKGAGAETSPPALVEPAEPTPNPTELAAAVDRAMAPPALVEPAEPTTSPEAVAAAVDRATNAGAEVPGTTPDVPELTDHAVQAATARVVEGEPMRYGERIVVQGPGSVKIGGNKPIGMTGGIVRGETPLAPFPAPVDRVAEQ